MIPQLLADEIKNYKQLDRHLLDLLFQRMMYLEGEAQDMARKELAAIMLGYAFQEMGKGARKGI